MALTELAGQCFDGSIELGEYDESTERLRRRVLAQIRGDRRRRHFALRQALRVAAIAAALVSLLTATAYGLGLFELHKNRIPEDVTVHGQWIERDSEGHIVDVQDMDYSDTNLTFTYDCQAAPHAVVFRPGWLPMEGSGFGEDGWYSYYWNYGENDAVQIPYNIEIFYAHPDFQLVLMYQSDILEETTWGEYEVTKLVNHNPLWGDDNYVLLFHPEHGYMIRVGGCLDMETMERIAQNLEVRVLEEEAVYDPDYNIGCLNIGRG